MGWPGEEVIHGKTRLNLELLTQQLFQQLPWISKKSSARILGPLSLGFPDPLNTRPVLGGVEASKIKPMHLKCFPMEMGGHSTPWRWVGTANKHWHLCRSSNS